MISRKQFFLGIVMASFLSGILVLIGMNFISSSTENGEFRNPPVAVTTSFENVEATTKDYIVPEGINFLKASRKAVPAVVHITNTYRSQNNSTWSRLLGRERRSRRSTGSGVIISPDGYVVTNYHVVENAEELSVRLDDNRRLDAKIIGTDPDTDLALIKINTNNLPYVKFGNSKKTEIGQWVLAIGNPFDLNNTVTAGIISAKARSINMAQRSRDGLNYSIESFLQTDAVVNRGNSGGALVNLEGELIGINTAIATNTGSFSGYSFAVPSALVQKVANDLLEFGEVRRGLMGVQITDADGTLTEELTGVLLSGVSPGGAAAQAGLKSEDVIVKIDGETIHTTSELQEMVALKRPGDDVKVTFKRNGKENNLILTLMEREKMIAENVAEEITTTFSIEGAAFADLTSAMKEQLNLEGGVQVLELGEGTWKASGIKEGYVITKVGDQDVEDLAAFERMIQRKDKDFYVMGKYPDGEKEYYRIRW